VADCEKGKCEATDEAAGHARPSQQRSRRSLEKEPDPFFEIDLDQNRPDLEICGQLDWPKKRTPIRFN
jgi:hypothetical protein